MHSTHLNRHQFRGKMRKMRKIIRGDVVSEVDVETPWGIVTSVVTTCSIDDLELVMGSEVVALVQVDGSVDCQAMIPALSRSSIPSTKGETCLTH